MIDQKLDYLHNNTVQEGVVREPQDYIYSSAIDYYVVNFLKSLKIDRMKLKTSGNWRASVCN